MDKEEKAKRDKKELLNILKLVAPGTLLRAAIEKIVKSRMGGLIVVYTEEMDKIIEGGFEINCDISYQKLFELCKMDGAIILSPDLRKIIYSNVLLAPDISINSKETGTRHKAAERTAKQFNTLAIAISERHRTITVYYGELRYVLRGTQELLRRATESLQILEKQREIFEELIQRFNVIEFTNLVTINDVCLITQRIETINRIASTIFRYVTELGKEGTLIKMRLRELVKGMEEEKRLIIKDYSKLLPEKTENLLSSLLFEELLEISNLINIFGYSSDHQVSAKGYRILNRVDIDDEYIERIVKEFKILENILSAPIEKIGIILGEEMAREFFAQINQIREQVILGKKI